MKRTKIIATIGPASDTEEMLKKLFLTGVNVARLNFSHGDHESHKATMDRIKKVREELKLPIAIMLDTKGPEIRTQNIENMVPIQEGDLYDFLSGDIEGTEREISITYKELWKDVVIGQKILVDDGLLELEVVDIQEGKITTRALNDGFIAKNKGINVPGALIRLPSLTEKDISDIVFGIEQDVDFIAASFIRRGEDILAIREVLEKNHGNDIKIIAKIENQEGVENMDAIIDLADGIMVARGDLGVEIETELVPLVQKSMIQKTIAEGIPVITATQMLDSMIRNPRPTRAEASDVANAIIDGTSCIMLSGETASGRYPLEAVETMARIAVATEKSLDYGGILERSRHIIETTTTNVIARNTCEMARELGAKAIVVATTTGYSSRAVAKFQPEIPIIAVTPDEKALRQMSLHWGIEGLLGNKNSKDIINDTIDVAKKQGKVQDGDLVILIAGIPTGKTGSTNLIKVHQVSKVALRGTGIGKGTVIGKARIVNDSFDFTRDFTDGDILVAKYFTKDLMPFVERCGGFIVEEEGMTSSAAIVAINTAKPTIVGAENAVETLNNAKFVTMDVGTGEIYLGVVDAK